MLAKVRNCNFQATVDGGRITCDISWENAWKNEINRDAVYLFFKYKQPAQWGYQSVYLKEVLLGNESEFVEAQIVESGLGCFISLKNEGAEQKVSLKQIDFMTEKIESVEALEAFIIEMVYIPEEAYELGEPSPPMNQGGKAINCFFTYGTGGTYRIASSAAIAFGPENGKLFCETNTPMSRQGEESFQIPMAFPNGYQAMWYMKYPLTEENYVKFLNCLTRKQQKSHVTADIAGTEIAHIFVMTDSDEEKERCAVLCRTTVENEEVPIEFFTTAMYREMNIISVDDITAFACFAGLRPITELEFEKAARGPLPAVPLEFAWGTNCAERIVCLSGVDGSGEELPIPAAGVDICNANFAGNTEQLQGKKVISAQRTGWGGPISAGTMDHAPVVPGRSVRECRGLSYYGVSELSGNLWEMCITIGNNAGRCFDGSCGNGILDEDGHHTIENWPDPKTGMGFGVRGASYPSTYPGSFYLTSRAFGAHTKDDRRYHGGIRLGY